MAGLKKIHMIKIDPLDGSLQGFQDPDGQVTELSKEEAQKLQTEVSLKKCGTIYHYKINPT